MSPFELGFLFLKERENDFPHRMIVSSFVLIVRRIKDKLISTLDNLRNATHTHDRDHHKIEGGEHEKVCEKKIKRV